MKSKDYAVLKSPGRPSQKIVNYFIPFFLDLVNGDFRTNINFFELGDALSNVIVRPNKITPKVGYARNKNLNMYHDVQPDELVRELKSFPIWVKAIGIEQGKSNNITTENYFKIEQQIEIGDVILMSIVDYVLKESENNTMRIRPYIEEKDYQFIGKWIDNERIHALWCAGMTPYPLTRQNLHDLLERNAREWTDSAYVATEDDGTPVGFFCYSVNTENNEGFLKMVVVDPAIRGKGCGKEMLELALQYAFLITGAELVQINVFTENHAARRCYEKIGFTERAFTEHALSFQGESWGRYNLVIRRPQ